MVSLSCYIPSRQGCNKWKNVQPNKCWDKEGCQVCFITILRSFDRGLSFFIFWVPSNNEKKNISSDTCYWWYVFTYTIYFTYWKVFVFPNSNKSPKILNSLTVNLNQISELYLFHVLPDNLLEFTLFLTNLYISNLAIKSPIFKKFLFPKAML